MSRARMRALEARRLTLLGRCEEQRLDLAQRISQLGPRAQLTAWSRRRAGGGTGGANPLTWVVGALSLLMMLRRKKKSAGAQLGWIAGLMALASRTTRLVRLIAQVRALYLGFQATRRARAPHPARYPRSVEPPR
jgi:hypothetical protein